MEGGAAGRLGGCRPRRVSGCDHAGGFHRGWWPRAPREAAPWQAVQARQPAGAPPIVTAWPVGGPRTPGHGCAEAARAAVLAQAARFCLADALIAHASTPLAPWRRSTALSWSPGGPFLSHCCVACPPLQRAGRARCSRSAREVGLGPGAWLIRRPGSRYRVSGWGGRRRSRAPAARPCAGWRSSSPLPSGGAGTTGTGAVRGRTRRPTSPAAARGRGQASRGRGSRWLAYPVRAGGLGVADLVWEGSGAWWSPWWLGRAVPGCLPAVGS
jgi:hypothetical protein